MNTKSKILIAFILNVFFSIFEFIGGMFCGSISILSDAIHDMGDALSIGLSYIMERNSEKKPDNKYTYGYRRYSVLGGLITTIILISGSILVIINSIQRFISPTQIQYDQMIVIAIIGCIINFIAAKLTHSHHSINQKAVSLHMMEDMLGWIAVLIGAIVIKFTNWSFIDPCISILISIFILYHAIKNVIAITSMFLIKTPSNINIINLKQSLVLLPGIKDVHHIHVWALDEANIIASMHVVAEYSSGMKNMIKQTLKKHGINHSTIEFENINEHCHDKECNPNISECKCGHHH
jgi:cobalt-zinc-cadmium efflux system protein